MKVTKKGRLKLEKDEIRFGNFFVKREKSHIKFTDLNDVSSQRISVHTAKGQVCAMMVDSALGGDEGARKMLSAYCVVMFNVCTCVFDSQFLEDINKAATDCVARHKDVYGVKDEVTEEEDAKVLQEERELEEAMEEVRKEEGIER